MRYFERVDELGDDERATGEAVTDVLAVGTTLLVSVLVMSQILTAVPSNAGRFQGARDQIVTVLNSSFLLAAIIPLAIVAGALLYYVRGFDSRR